MSFLDRCSGICEHGDFSYDDDESALSYDGSECLCRKCDNFSVCQTWTPNPSLCRECDAVFGLALVPTTKSPCPICGDTLQLYLHSACCGHSFCADCLRGCYTQRPDQPLPSEYGLFRTCGCEDEPAPWGTHQCDVCAETLQRWEATEDGTRWSEACMEVEGGERRCPLCRSKKL